MSSGVMEKAIEGQGLANVNKEALCRTLDQIKDRASSILLFTLQWKDIEEQLDLSKNALEKRAKELEELEESINGRISEVEKREERLRSVEATEKELVSLHETIKERLNRLEMKHREFDLKQKADTEKRKEEITLMELYFKQIESVHRYVDENLKKLDMCKKSTEYSFEEQIVEETIWKVKEELVWNLEQLHNCTKNFETGKKWFGDRMSNCESRFEEQIRMIELKEKKFKERDNDLRLKEKQLIEETDKSRREFEPLTSLLIRNAGAGMTTNAECLSIHLKNKASVASLILSLDPTKLVLDAIAGSYRVFLKEDIDSSIVSNCIALLEKMMTMNPEIEPDVKQEAAQLGIEWFDKITANLGNSSQDLGFLLFVAVYGLASSFTPDMLLKLLERVLWYDHAPKLFQLLGFKDHAPGVIESLIQKEEYFPAIKFICEFQLFKFNSASLIHMYMKKSEKAAQEIVRTDKLRAFREKQKADVVNVIEYIKEKKLESKLPFEVLENLLVRLEKQLEAMEPIDPDSLMDVSAATATATPPGPIVPSEPENRIKRQKIAESIDDSCQNLTVKSIGSESAPSRPGLPETKPDIFAGPVEGGSSRALTEKTGPLEASRCSSDPAKHLLDSSMVLHQPPNAGEGEYEFQLRVSSHICFQSLNQLKILSPKIRKHVRNEAKKLAVSWKSTLLKNKSDDMEVVCFLLFLGVYEIVSQFKAKDLLALLESGYWRIVSPNLCQFLGLTPSIAGFIQNMIRAGQFLKAVNYVYSLDVVESFSPVLIIKEFLAYIPKHAERSSKNSTLSQVEIINKQIKALRDAVKCIMNHNLESEFQIEDLKQQIKMLFKEKEKLKSEVNEAKPDSPTFQAHNPMSDLEPDSPTPQARNLMPAPKPYSPTPQSRNLMPPPKSSPTSQTCNAKPDPKPDLPTPQTHDAKPAPKIPQNSNAKPDPKPDPPAPQTHAKPDLKIPQTSNAKPDPKPDPPAPQACDTKPDPKPNPPTPQARDAKPDPKPDPPAPQTHAKPDPKLPQISNAKPGPKPNPPTPQARDAKPDPKPNPPTPQAHDAKPDPKPNTSTPQARDTKPDPKPNLPTPQAHAKPAPKVPQTSKAKSDPKADLPKPNVKPNLPIPRTQMGMPDPVGAGSMPSTSTTFSVPRAQPQPQPVTEGHRGIKRQWEDTQNSAQFRAWPEVPLHPINHQPMPPPQDFWPNPAWPPMGYERGIPVNPHHPSGYSNTQLSMEARGNFHPYHHQHHHHHNHPPCYPPFFGNRIMTSSVSVPTISIRSILEKEKLNGANFLKWFRTLRMVLGQEKKLYVLEAPMPDKEPPTNATRVVKDAYSKHLADNLDVTCLMLGTMSSELQKHFEKLSAFMILDQLKTMFQGKARQEQFTTVKALVNCKLAKGSPVSPHVLKMKGYLDQLESLGVEIIRELATDLVLQSLPDSFNRFVLNYYNMHGMEKSLTELHEMLKTAEQSLKSSTSSLMIEQGNSSHGSSRKRGRDKGKVKGKGKATKVAKVATDATKPKFKKDKGECRFCHEIGHWKRNCKLYLEDLKKKFGEASDSGTKRG